MSLPEAACSSEDADEKLSEQTHPCAEPLFAEDSGDEDDLACLGSADDEEGQPKPSREATTPTGSIHRLHKEQGGAADPEARLFPQLCCALC